MSANTLIKKHLMPLLSKRGDIEVVGRWIIMKPVRHVLRGILILSRDHDRYFAPEWAVTHFCEPIGHFPLNWGDIIHRETSGLFYWSDPETPAQFVKQIERDILPLFRSIETLDDMVAYLRTKPFPHRNFEIDELRGLSLHTARGDFAAARRNLDDLRNGRSWWCMPGFAEKEVASVVDALGPLLDADDRPGMARQLAEWEAMRIAQLPKGMAKIWEPTPFPVEAPPR